MTRLEEWACCSSLIATGPKTVIPRPQGRVQLSKAVGGGSAARPAGGRENLQKTVDNSKIHVKIFKILQRDTKKKQCKTS